MKTTQQFIEEKGRYMNVQSCNKIHRLKHQTMQKHTFQVAQKYTILGSWNIKI